jgi:hypothetical protein
VIDKNLYEEVLVALVTHGPDWHTIFDPEEVNAVSSYWFALDRDSPAKLWWNAEVVHPAIYQSLGIDPKDYAAGYAIQPFRLHVSADTGRKAILAAYPAPRVFDDRDDDWLNITHVIAWNPVKDTAHVMGDPEPQIVGALTDAANVIYSSPRAFFQAWACRRAAFAVQRQTARQRAWHVIPKEADETPGALLIGHPEQVRWNPAVLPAELHSVGIPRAALWKAILKAAGLPSIREKAA